jgi:suppressor of ftsI/bilirubin oxidase
VLLDLRAAQLGERMMLVSLPFDAMHFSDRKRASSGNTADVPANGAPLELMLLRVIGATKYDAALPAVLSSIEPVDVPGARPRRFGFDHARGLWRINGQSYRMTDTAFSVKRGAREVWEFRNDPPAMPHPIHIHGFQYRVLERKGSPAHLRALAVTATGLPPTELGWKDTVLLWPGESIRILVDFTHPFPGDQVYMLQCHNLEHETHGMMVNFRIEA